MNLHPIIHSGLARERQRDLERALRMRRLAMIAQVDDQATFDGLLIRHAMPGDDLALARLAALEGRRRLRGDVLVASVRGAVRAAIGVADGEVLADPSRPTADLTELLRVRARQVSAGATAAAAPTR
jgi:hypothetical protein